MTDVERLMQNCRVNLPGAVDGAIKLEYFNVMDEFLSDTNLWQETIAVSITTTNLTYSVASAQGGACARLLYVVDSDGAPRTAGMLTPGTMDVPKYPSAADTWQATIAMTVTEPLDGSGYPVFPAWILGTWGNQIAEGIIGKMMTQVAKPYSNQALAIFHLKNFGGAKTSARIEVTRRNTFGTQAWRFPRSFHTRARR